MEKVKEIFLEINEDAYREINQMCEEYDHSESSTHAIDNNANLNRTLSWFETHDCVAISAWRKEKVRAENQANNLELKSKLSKMCYGVIQVKGFYPEGGNEITKEESLIVINIRRDVMFKHRIKLLSELYDQDSFLFKPAGAHSDAILVYTKDVGDLRKGEEKILGKLHVHSQLKGSSSCIGGKFVQFE